MMELCLAAYSFPAKRLCDLAALEHLNIWQLMSRSPSSTGAARVKSFSKKYARSIKHFNSAKFFKTGFLAKKPCIHVLNLEDYLEIKDFNNVKRESSTLQYPIRNFQFVASTEFGEAFDSIISKSSWEKYIENLFIKTKVFKSLLSNIFEL